MRGLGGRQGMGCAMAALAAIASSGCGGGGVAEVGVVPDDVGNLSVRSPAFEDGDILPTRSTCDGGGDVPPLEWEAGPEDTDSYAILITDRDAPGGTFVHLAVAGIPADRTSLPADADMPAGAVVGTNGVGEPGWYPACPPEGDDAHRYVFTVYALEDAPDLAAGFDPQALVDHVADASLAAGSVSATYGR